LAATQKIKTLEKLVDRSAIRSNPKLDELYALYTAKVDKTAAIRALKKKISAVHNVLQLDELKCRKRVLRRLGFTTADDVIEMKGRVACEVSTGDELLLTEMIFQGVFNTLEPEHVAALLSCFVFQEKVMTPLPELLTPFQTPVSDPDRLLLVSLISQSTQVVKLKEELAAPLRIMQENARRIAKVCRECKLPVVEEEYVQSFKVELMDAVMQWCRGAKFSEVCKMTDVCVAPPRSRFPSPSSLVLTARPCPLALRARSSVRSGGCRSSCARWPKRPRRSATPSSRRSSRARSRCSSGPTLLSLPPRQSLLSRLLLADRST